MIKKIIIWCFQELSDNMFRDVFTQKVAPLAPDLSISRKEKNKEIHDCKYLLNCKHNTAN